MLLFSFLPLSFYSCHVLPISTTRRPLTTTIISQNTTILLSEKQYEIKWHDGKEDITVENNEDVEVALNDMRDDASFKVYFEDRNGKTEIR